VDVMENFFGIQAKSSLDLMLAYLIRWLLCCASTVWGNMEVHWGLRRRL